MYLLVFLDRDSRQQQRGFLVVSRCLLVIRVCRPVCPILRLILEVRYRHLHHRLEGRLILPDLLCLGCRVPQMAKKELCIEPLVP